MGASLGASNPAAVAVVACVGAKAAALQAGSCCLAGGFNPLLGLALPTGSGCTLSHIMNIFVHRRASMRPIVWGFSLSLLAGTALATGDPGAALIAPIERAPTSWGGAVMTPPVPPEATRPVASPVKPVIPPVAPVAVKAPATADLPSPTVRAADEVGGLVVQGRSVRAADQTVEKCVIGPAWWRVSSPTATLWIMATPDRMPVDTEWDDTCLRKRLAAARLVIVPALPLSGADDPYSRGQTPLRPAAVPLDQRISPALWAQLSRRIDGNTVRAAEDRDWARLALVDDLAPGAVRQLIPASGAGANWGDYSVYRNSPRTTLQVIRDTPNLFAPPVLVAKRLSSAFDLPGRMGNPAAQRAAELAGEANMLVGRTANSAAQFSDLTYLSNPSEADQEACLKSVLDELDAGHAGLGMLDQVQAWARGDVENGLRHMSPITACSFGDLSVRFWSTVVAQDMELIDRAIQAGGVAVAVLEYDPLFMRGGVMERLEAKGLKVETPGELQ
ncbi:MAG: TraB/GumN family protein [Caulobacteraceae bacterium]|nr:TraB/GumN family protein [Caulobacteraceae bacterium]